MLIERTFLHLFVNEKKFYDDYKHYCFCGMNIIARTAGRISHDKFQQLKGKGFFGHLMRIIKIYSSIQTTDEQIIRVIRENSDLWAKVTKEVIKLHEEISFKALGTYDLPNYNPQTIEFKVKQTSGTVMPHPRPRNDLLDSINDEYSSWSKTTMPNNTHDSIMHDKDSLFKQPLEEITSANHLFDKPKKDLMSSPTQVKSTSLTDTGSPIFDRKLEEQIRHQRANSPRNESFQEFIEKKKIEAQEQIKLQRTLSQEKSRSQYGPRSPSPGQRRVNCWKEEDDASGKISPTSKKAISKSMIVPGQQHDRNRKDIPKVKVMMLERLPVDRRYRKVDSSDMQFLNFLGWQAQK